MKTYFTILFILGTSLAVKAQNFSKVEQTKLDSLNLIINSPASHDTSLANAYIAMTHILSVSNPDTDLYMSTKVRTITEKALEAYAPPLVKKSLLTSLAHGFIHIGNVYKDRGEIEKCLAYYHKSLKIAEELGNKAGIARSLNNIGNVYKNQGEIEKCLAYYHKSLKIAEELGNKSGIALSLNNIGIVYFNRGEIEKCLAYYHKSLKIAEELGNKAGIARSLNNIGNVYKNQGEIEKCLAYYHKSLKIDEELGNKAGISSSLNNIGVVYFNQGEIEKCLEYFHKSLKIAEELGNKAGIARSLNNIGGVYKHQGEIEKCLDYYHRSLKIAEELGNKAGIARSLSNIGLVYSDQGELEKCLAYYHKSLKIREELGNKQGIAMSLNNIGFIYYDKGTYELAQNYAKKSMEIAKELGYPNEIKSAANLLYKVYNKTHKYKDALAMYELFINMRDSISNEETQKASIKQNMQYEYEKQSLADSLETSKELALKDIEIDKQKAEAKAERTTKYGLFGGLALVLVIAFVLARSVKQKKKANKEISLQKEAVEKSKLHIEELHKEVTDSIHYAAHIQNAILTSDAYWQRMLPEHFVFFKPRDIVSGDFYWAYECPTGTVSSVSTSARGEVRGKKIWIAADCTGHGVPGGFMSMLGNTFLNEIVIEQGVHDAAEILNKLRDHIIKALASDVGDDEGLEMKDGMDLALCILHPGNMLEYAGANNPLWILSSVSNKLPLPPGGKSDGGKTPHENPIQESAGAPFRAAVDSGAGRAGEEREGDSPGEDPNAASHTARSASRPTGLDSARDDIGSSARITTSENGRYTLTEIKADKQPIGKYTHMTPFTSHKLQLQPGDQIYTFTDGYPDQFGGPKLKKYMSKRLKKFLFTIADKPMIKQKELILAEFEDWRKDTEQVDDVCIVGVRI